MTTLLKCPICGGTERSLLPSSVCEECGCDMKPDASDARRVLFDKSQPKEARVAAMDVLQPKPAEAREPGCTAEFSGLETFDLSHLCEAREPVGDADLLACHLIGIARHLRAAYTRLSGDADYIEQAAEALAQPRDTPRDSGDAIRVTLTEYGPGITTTIAEAAMQLPAGTYWLIPDAAMQSTTGEPT